jgi:hypothetical protein
VRLPWTLVLLVAVTVRAAGPPTVVFLSDFGTRDDAVAICKGVMLQVEPALRVIDLTHDVPPYSVADGARLLADTAEHYPAGTVFPCMCLASVLIRPNAAQLAWALAIAATFILFIPIEERQLLRLRGDEYRV